MPFLASEGCFWPLTASMTSEVKNKHANVYPHRNLRNSSEINFSIGPYGLTVNRAISPSGLFWIINKITTLAQYVHRLHGCRDGRRISTLLGPQGLGPFSLPDFLRSKFYQSLGPQGPHQIP